jgi:hypothetical protein
MKNNIDYQKYSILIILLLLLIFVYIHIENPIQIMKGGIDTSNLIKKMINNDKVYINTFGHPIIRWVILVIILGLLFGAYHFGSIVFYWTGEPGFKIEGYQNSYKLTGGGFLAKFYALTQDTLIFQGNPKYLLVTTKEERDLYMKGIVEFKETTKDKIAVFCNTVYPCNKTKEYCSCPGYNGPECGPDPNKTLPDGSTPGKYAQIIKEKNSENAENFLGFIPKCCCLSKIKPTTGPRGKYIKNKIIAFDYNNDKYWKKNEKPNQANPALKTVTYEFKKELNITELEELPSSSNTVELPGCSSTEYRKNGVAVKPDDKDCECPDGDPTLNYVGHINNLELTPLEKKQNLFQKWDSDTEKSYRVKNPNANISLNSPSTSLNYQISDKVVPTFLPDFYYKDPSKKTELKEKDSKGNKSSDIYGYLYNLTYVSDNDKTIIFDTSIYGDKDFTGEAIYMNKQHKYYYQLPNASLNLSSNNQTSAQIEFKKAIQDAKNEFNKTPSLSPSVSRAGFFGGIYENIQTYIGLKK